MLLAVGFVPVPPLLVPALAAGAAGELDDCRSRCHEVLRILRRTKPQRLVVVASGPAGTFTSGDRGSLAGFGLPAAVAEVRLPGPRPGSASGAAAAAGAGAQPSLPPDLAVAAWLLADAGWDGPVEAHSLPQTSSKDDVCELADAIMRDGADLVVLAVGEGAARLDAKAPGAWDPRAAEWQGAATHALAGADLDAVLTLDPGQGAQLLATGRAPWQVAAAAAGHADAEWEGALLADERPYGVAYVTAVWTPA